MKTKQITIKKRIQNKRFTLIQHECSKNIRRNEGFTLIELLVSISIFSLIISAMSGAFISTIKAQRKLVAFQQLLAQTSYLEEYMGRSIRMGKKDISGVCIGVKSNYEIIYDDEDNDKGIKFLNYNRDCQEFYVSDSQLWENKNGLNSALTSSDLIIENIKIELLGNSQTDNLQPRVTIFLKIKGAGLKPEDRPEIKIQTTISQRNSDVRY